MNRVELINEVAEATGNSKKDTENILSALLEVVQETVSNGDKVTITGFGTFEARKREARVGRNPLTGESINIAAKTVPAFKAGRTFKNAVNN